MRPEDILIVNDGSTFLKTIGLVLVEEGHRTCVIDSAFEAVAELARKYFRLVIVKLPGETAASLALLDAVKNLNPEARLIILGEDVRFPVEAFQLAVDDYILLPCRPVEVWRRITGCLKALREGFLRQAFLYRESGAEPDICDIREDVVAPILEELWDDLQKHDVALENHLDFLPSHLGTVKGDKVALRSVFRNLINNAIQYGGKGCSLKIDYDRSEPFFRLQVFNSGPVPPKKTRRTLSSSLPSGKDKGNVGLRGLGLGLRLSQEILQSYGGDILCEPQSGGTNVQVILPLS